MKQNSQEIILIDKLDIEKLLSYIPYPVKNTVYSAGLTMETIRNWQRKEVEYVQKSKIIRLIENINYRETDWFTIKKIKQITLNDILK